MGRLWRWTQKDYQPTLQFFSTRTSFSASFSSFWVDGATLQCFWGSASPLSACDISDSADSPISRLIIRFDLCRLCRFFPEGSFFNDFFKITFCKEGLLCDSLWGNWVSKSLRVKFLWSRTAWAQKLKIPVNTRTCQHRADGFKRVFPSGVERNGAETRITFDGITTLKECSCFFLLYQLSFYRCRGQKKASWLNAADDSSWELSCRTFK